MKPKHKKMWEVVGAVIGTVFIGGLMAVIFIEWMVGCGETYIAADGTRHAYECVFIGERK